MIRKTRKASSASWDCPRDAVPRRKMVALT
jgi:hypothetical protein